MCWLLLSIEVDTMKFMRFAMVLVLAVLASIGAASAYSYAVPQVSQAGTRAAFTNYVNTDPGYANVDNSAVFYSYISPPLQGGYAPGGIRYMLGLRQPVPMAYPAVQMPYYYQPYYAYPYLNQYGSGYSWGGFGGRTYDYFYAPGGIGSF
ncbi:MAG: hypothetical protein HC945_00670 [Nitrosarchaeum sp.]|nr:hypothetical protein [Nitrosarchaeum sp.]